MKKTPLTLTLALAGLALIAPLLWAHGDDDMDGERRVHMRVATDGDMIEIDDLGDLAVGESRTYYSDDGVPVIITRTESGYEIDKDGEVITVAMPHHHGAHAFLTEGDHHGAAFFFGDEGDTVFINKDGQHVEIDEDHEMVFISGHGDGDGDGDGHHFVWHHADAGHGDALQRLTAAGVLDEVGAETRRKIIEALATPADGHRVKRKVMIQTSADGDRHEHEK